MYLIQIPSKGFTQFRLAGEGLNDDNLRADITKTEHEIEVKGVQASSKFGLLTATEFDVFVFEQESDYNCYIEAMTLWVEHDELKQCDFVMDKPDSVHEQVSEWSTKDSHFLSKD